MLQAINAQMAIVSPRTVSFVGTFQNPPQIILTLERIDQSYYPMDVIFNTQNILTTSFQIYLKCINATSWAQRIRWFAIDDQRVQVINQFNLGNFSTFTVPHSNPNAIAGFVSVFSIGFTGNIEFQVKITEITPTNATIEITDPNNKKLNLKSIEFQIILAAPESIKKNNTYTVSSYFTSDFIGVIPTAYYMNPIQGFNFALTDAMRFFFSYTSSNPIRYTYSIWFGTYFPITHLQVWIAYNFTQYLSLTCSHTRISLLLDFSVSSLTQTVKILETQIELSNIGIYTIIFDKALKDINFQFQLSCDDGKKIQSSLFMYPQNIPSKQIQTQYHLCGGINKIITYYARLTQQMVAHEEVNVAIQSDGFVISQVLFNQVKSVVNLVSFKIIDQ